MADFRHPQPQPAFPESSLRSPPSHRYNSQVNQGTVSSHTPIPENLYRTTSDAFNVDPDVPYLAAEGEDAQASQAPPHVDRDFVGGFVGGVKRVFLGNKRNRSIHPEEGHVIITTNPEPFTSPSELQHPTQVHHTPPPFQTPPSVASPSRRSNSTADATAIDHEPLPEPLPMGSPVFADPQPGSDYAKMDSPTPPPSTASLGSYISRVHKFFRDLNDLPWVASERVTVDYYPGFSQRAAGRRSAAHARSPPPQPRRRPIISWYGNNNPAQQGHADLFSQSSSPSSVVTEVRIQGAQDLPKNARVVYPAIYGPASTLQHNQYPNTTPALVYAPAPATYRATARTESSSSSHEAPHRRVYPHGYVSYQHHGAATAQYPGHGIHNMTQVLAPSSTYHVPSHT